MTDKERTLQIIKDILNESGISESEAIALLKDKISLESNAKLKEAVESNRDLVGRCFVKTCTPHSGLFPEMNRYYKVISNRSKNEYRVECLIFDEYPTYWFEYQAHKYANVGDYYLGNFNFKSFIIDSIMVKNIIQMQEITEEEFDQKAMNYVQQLLNMEFCADHYRFGGKLPTDDGWSLSIGENDE